MEVEITHPIFGYAVSYRRIFEIQAQTSLQSALWRDKGVSCVQQEVMYLSGRNCYVVSYDIMDPKRLQRVHKTMKGFGEPIHYSVFRCDLRPKGRVELVAALTDLIKHDQDRIMIVDLGPADGGAMERIEFIGVRAEESSRKGGHSLMSSNHNNRYLSM